MARKTYKGLYKPQNFKKYKGDYTNIVYRSLLERMVMVRLDTDPNVLQWSSESIIIPYFSPVDKKMHRYFPDMWMKLKHKDGSVKEYLIEIKPKVQTVPPKQPKRKTIRYLNECKTFAVNMAKWDAAKKYCAAKNINFTIWTDEQIKPYYKKDK
jgi:hypothetical protein